MPVHSCIELPSEDTGLKTIIIYPHDVPLHRRPTGDSLRVPSLWDKHHKDHQPLCCWIHRSTEWVILIFTLPRLKNNLKRSFNKPASALTHTHTHTSLHLCTACLQRNSCELCLSSSQTSDCSWCNVLQRWAGHKGCSTCPYRAIQTFIYIHFVCF